MSFGIFRVFFDFEMKLVEKGILCWASLYSGFMMCSVNVEAAVAIDITGAKDIGACCTSVA